MIMLCPYCNKKMKEISREEDGNLIQIVFECKCGRSPSAEFEFIRSRPHTPALEPLPKPEINKADFREIWNKYMGERDAEGAKSERERVLDAAINGLDLLERDRMLCDGELSDTVFVEDVVRHLESLRVQPESSSSKEK